MSRKGRSRRTPLEPGRLAQAGNIELRSYDVGAFQCCQPRHSGLFARVLATGKLKCGAMNLSPTSFHREDFRRRSRDDLNNPHATPL